MAWTVYTPDPEEELIFSVVGDVSRLLMKSKVPFADIASEAGLSKSTVRKLALGETRRPQLRTIILLSLVMPEVWHAVDKRVRSTGQVHRLKVVA